MKIGSETIYNVEFSSVSSENAPFLLGMSTLERLGNYSIVPNENKIIINKSKKPKNRIIISDGLHGIEGFVGHCSIITFLNEIITQLTTLTQYSSIIFLLSVQFASFHTA